MSMPVKWILLLFSFCGFGIATVLETLAADLPPNWPWRGIVLTSASLTNAADIAYLAKIKVNAVELHLEVRLLAERLHLTPEQSWNQNIAWADHILDECKKYGISGIVSVFQIPSDPTIGLNQESPEFWGDSARLQEAISIASKLAEHFKNRGPELGAYSVLSEPVLREKGVPRYPPAWSGLLKSIVMAIRYHDPKRFISVTPCLGGLPKNYTGVLPLDDGHLIYEAHMYIPGTYTHQGIYGNPLGVSYPGFTSLRNWNREALEEYMSPLIEFKNKYKVPVFIGEFSAVRWAPNAEHYLKDLIDIFDNNGWGWAYFQYKSWHGWDPDFDSLYSTNDDSRKHYVGRDTARWKLLREEFSKNKGRGVAAQ